MCDLGRRLGPLEWLAAQAGWFFDAHRALDDARAALHLLTESGAEPMRRLVDTVNASRSELSLAADVVGELGTVLRREMRFRWCPDRRVWYRSVPNDELDTVYEATCRWIEQFVGIEARGIPFGNNQAVKARGYRFEKTPRKVWWTVVPREQLDEEVAVIRASGGEAYPRWKETPRPDVRVQRRCERYR